MNDELIRQGYRNSPACCVEEGNLDQALQYQETCVHFLTEIQLKFPDIISEDVDVGGDYGIGSLFRRNSYVGALNTRAPYLH